MFLEAFRASTQRPFRVGLARSHVSATMSCRLQPTLSRDTSSTTRSWPNVREHRRRPAAMVGSLVKCRSPLFNPGGCYKKTLSLGSLQRSDPGSYVCAVWRRACGKANVKMNSRLGGGQPPGLKSGDRAKRGIYLTASR
mgnify:CR=1 FL=1